MFRKRRSSTFVAKTQCASDRENRGSDGESGEPGANEQFVAVLGKQLRDDPQVLVESCDIRAYTVLD